MIKTMKMLTLFLGVFISTSVLAVPINKFGAFIPEGWILLRHAEGHLNGDGKQDAVLILEKDDPLLRRKNDLLGPDVLDLNPRRLLILFQNTKGYEAALQSDSFLPSRSDEEIPCRADPLEDGDIAISRGRLLITLNYWTSCGGWGSRTNTYIFRYENKRFRLIGAENIEFMRNTGEQTNYSVNYLTGDTKTTYDDNSVKNGKLKDNKPHYLDNLSVKKL